MKSHQKREASEREARIGDRQFETKWILERACRCETLILAGMMCLVLITFKFLVREDITSRRKKMKQRREYLAAARLMQAEEQANLRRTTVEVAEEKSVLLRADVKWKLIGKCIGDVLTSFGTVFRLYEHRLSQHCQGHILLSFFLHLSCYLPFSLFRYPSRSTPPNPPRHCRSLPTRK